MKYTGAGILLLEKYNNQDVICLFNENGNFTEPGGGIDIGESVEEAAYREGREETSNLITILPYELQQFGSPIIHNEYVCFALYITGLSESVYNKNLSLTQRCKSKSWNETDGFVRFPLKKILVAATKGETKAIDINGKERNIRDRTMKLLTKSVNVLMGLTLTQPHNLIKHLITNSKMDCLIGTYTYRMELTNDMDIPPSPPRKHRYAIYAAPDLQTIPESDQKYIKSCGDSWGGAHVTIVGFHREHPPLKLFLQYISNSGAKDWKLNPRKAVIQNNKLLFNSRTLDKIADFLKHNGFKRVKGPIHSGDHWHINCQSNIHEKAIKILNKCKWSLTIVRKEGDSVRWQESYPLKML